MNFSLEKKRLRTKFRPRLRGYLLTGFLLCFFILSFIGCAKNPGDMNLAKDVPIELTDGWAYRWGDSPIDADGVPLWIHEDAGQTEWNPIAYDDGILNPPDRQGGKILWLRITLPEKILQAPKVWIQQIAFAGEIYLGKDIIYRFKSINVPAQGHFTENISHKFSLHSNFQGKPLFFRIYSDDPTQIGLAFVKLGSQEAFGKLLIKEIFSIAIFGFIFVAAGLFALLLYIFRRKEKLYFVFGFLCLTMGLWVLSITQFGQGLLARPPILFYLTSLMPYLSAAGLCAYFEQIYGPGYKSILRRLWQFFLFYSALALFFLVLKFSFIYLFTVVIVFFAVFAIAIVIMFLMSLNKTFRGNREAAIISTGGTVLAFFGLYDILGGVFKLFPWTHNTYQWGMFVFILSLGLVLERRFRQNAIELKKSHIKLQEYSQTLENMVKERTKDLENKNVELAKTLKELKETQDHLIMQEKMASLGNLVAGVAHEINTPVGAVKSAADVLSRSLNKIKAVLKSGQSAEDILSSQEYKKPFFTLEENAQITSEASERITDIVKSLKSFARLDEADYQKANIHEGLDSTLTLINYEIKDRITIIKDYGKIPDINCFPNQLNQVFMNILMNAVAGLEKDGVITIKTFLESKNLVVKISDTGSGIPEKNLERIFDPGFTTRSQGVGTGLGLSISYNIIQKHHGKIKVESEVGKGSTFSIYLPIDLQSP